MGRQLIPLPSSHIALSGLASDASMHWRSSTFSPGGPPISKSHLTLPDRKPPFHSPCSRSDCIRNKFERVAFKTTTAAGANATFCEQCYCYVCDKKASECSSWTSGAQPHCNAYAGMMMLLLRARTAGTQHRRHSLHRLGD